MMGNYSYDEFSDLVEEVYDEFDKKYFDGLNAGIIIEENIFYHPESVDDDLIALGAYRRDLLGNSIVIYYGSFMKMFGYLEKEDLKEKIKSTLGHELTHHLEFSAGENGLEVEDLEFINKYKETKWQKF